MIKKMIPVILSTSVFFTCIGTFSFDANADNIFKLSCDTKKICVDYSAEKENKNVFFTVDCEDEVSGVELFDADTNEKITVLYDDGNIDQNGDVYMNDGVYSNYFNMEDKPVGAYQFYAQYTDAQGEVHTSNTVKIGVYRLFTDQELADMEAIQNAIEELLNSEEFKNSIPDKRFELAENLLNDLKEKGLIISYEKSPYGYQIDYVECTGTLGAISESVFIDSDKPVDNVDKTTTSSSSTTTPTTTTTVTTTVTTEADTEQTTDAGGSVTTETSTVPPTTTTGTETTLPQTGYSKWYQVLIAAAMGMIGVGSTAIVKSGIFRKKENNS